MSAKRSIFFDEWQACLRAHYKFVIQDDDMITEPTLRHVLLQTGLSDDELDDLAEEAHAEVPPDAAPESADGADMGDSPAEEMPGEPHDESADESASGQMALF